MEDDVAKAGIEREKAKSESLSLKNDLESVKAQLFECETELIALTEDIKRHEKERMIWIELQKERDALLAEKHRWAMTDEFLPPNEKDSRRKLDSKERKELENKLCAAEATVIQIRAELGFSISNHLTTSSDRLEILARDLIQRKVEYEKRLKEYETERFKWKEQVLKLKAQVSWILKDEFELMMEFLEESFDCRASRSKNPIRK